MTARLPLTPAQRTRRKQDLLLASTLARHQAMIAIDQIGDRTDRLVGAYRQARAWLSMPKVGAVASVAASLAALVALRHVRIIKLLRWGVLSWRVWKLAVGVLPGRRPSSSLSRSLSRSPSSRP